MKYIALRRALRRGCAALTLLATACSTGSRNECRYIVPTGDIFIVAGAYSAAATKVEYRHDGDGHRTVWSQQEELYVAAYAEGSRVDAGGVRWSRFCTETDDAGFNEDYMLFSGSALTPVGDQIAADQRLYALYPAAALCGEEDDEVEIAGTQKYAEGSFDADAVLMVSAPLAVTLPAEGTAHASAFRFRHHTGYLRLTFSGLPEDAAAERITKITLRAAGKPLCGTFRATIDDALGDWTFTPTEAAADAVELDFSESEVTVGDLEECWFALMPGEYGEVTITIATEGSAIVMQRSGLTVESGVIDARSITYNESADRVARPMVLTIDGNDLNIPKNLPLGGGTYTGTKDDIEFSYKKLNYTTVSGERCINFSVYSSDSGGTLWNTTPLPSPLECLEICFVDASRAATFVYTKTGASQEEFSEPKSCSGEEVEYVYPSCEDCRYFCIESRNTERAVRIKYIKITCAPN